MANPQTRPAGHPVSNPVHATPSASSTRKYPTPAHIPAPALQALIPRLTMTINEIDQFNQLLAQGQVDGSLPSWDMLLQRYATLLGRINSVSSYLSLPPPAPPLRPGAPPRGPDANRPALERVLVHPLNPLSDPAQIQTQAATSNTTHDLGAGPATSPGAQGSGNAENSNGTAQADQSANASAGLHPFAHEAFFQSINTQPLPSLLSTQTEVVSRASARAGWVTSDEAALRRLNAGYEVDGVPASAQGGGPAVVDQLRKQLVERLGREERAAKALRELVQEKEEEYDWGMRIDDEVEEEAEGSEVGGKGEEKGRGGQEEEEDLFGDDEDVKIIEAPTTAAVSASGRAAAVSDSHIMRNPREGWSVADYVRYMDTGKAPTPKVAAS